MAYLFDPTSEKLITSTTDCWSTMQGAAQKETTCQRSRIKARLCWL